MWQKLIARLLRPSPFKAGLLVTVPLVLLYLYAPGPVEDFIRSVDEQSEDLMFKLRGPVPTTGKVVIVDIDERSLKEIGQWPWPRTTVATLLERIAQCKPKAVGIDIVFAEEDRTSLKNYLPIIEKTVGEKPEFPPEELDHDEVLASVVEKYDCIVLGYVFRFATTPEEEPEAPYGGGDLFYVRAPGAMQASPLVVAKMIPTEAVLNIPVIDDAAMNRSGCFATGFDESGKVRRVPLVWEFQDSLYPSLALRMLLVGKGEPNAKVRVDERGISQLELRSCNIPTDRIGQMQVNYRGPSFNEKRERTFTYISAADILDEDVIDPRQLKDKYIVVGTSATGLFDLRATPFDPTFPGAEVHATIIDNVLEGKLINEPWYAVGVTLGLVALNGIMLSLILAFSKPLKGALVANVFIVGESLAGYHWLFHEGMNFNITYPLLTLFVVFGVVTLFNYFFEERQKRFIRHAFQHYLSANVMEQVLADPDRLRLGGERRELSIFFSDLQGFSSISEKLTPDQLTSLLNEYLSDMTSLVLESDGTLDKYEGDAIIAFWNAPLTQNNHALRAVKAGLLCQRKLAARRAEFEAQTGQQLHMRIGIHSGEVVVGNMGSRERFDYTVLGDAANLASRLEGANKAFGGYYMVSESTWNQLGDEIWGRRLGQIRVVGRETPVTVYEPMGLPGEERPEWIVDFERGVDLCVASAWKEAMQVFDKLSHDPASQVYFARCQELAGGRRREWDGIWNLTEK